MEIGRHFILIYTGLPNRIDTLYFPGYGQPMEETDRKVANDYSFNLCDFRGRVRDGELSVT
ncbi:MAG: hypothetical protein EA411_11175 [Saprospirales bacterium]|nr:MAG: hypothetical protein EA411_11175 [Saprospirales bacterium]